MTKVNNMCGVSIRYGDYQVGKTIGEEHEDAVGVPDLVLVDGKHGIRGVCEGKTFWTRGLSSSTHSMRSLWFGQLARYMDYHYLKFGCYTTYTDSVFLRRVSATTFQKSPVILSTTASTETGGEGGISPRECFLYFASISSRNSYRYPDRFGLNLTNRSLALRERRSSRLGKGETEDEVEDLAEGLETTIKE
ncbi:MAG: hypothetical protein M1840_005402 [Geoglossum simile]|nr:MAG: hypothetical protein M1840_005402 [Geoglossum simile]